MCTVEAKTNVSCAILSFPQVKLKLNYKPIMLKLNAGENAGYLTGA
jgi:hypothetical protein